MSEHLASLIAQAEAVTPMAQELATAPGRVLLADGDGLAYYCAGNDECEPGTARFNLLDKLRKAKAACGAERIIVLLTAAGSHKGYRYAVARVKPYQGQRSGSRRPKNWEFLRNLLEAGDLGPDISVEFTAIAEADDLFSRYSALGHDIVIYTQDKDMRMVPGLHLDWVDHRLVTLHRKMWNMVVNDKVYGRKWFWLQMLHGDSADNIPGLPFMTDGSIVGSGPNKGKLKQIPMGEVGANKLLREPFSNEVPDVVIRAYESCYGERWPVELLEQGILLWMRTDTLSDPFNVCHPGNPLAFLYEENKYAWAIKEIQERIKVVTDAEAEAERSRSAAGESAPSAG